LPSIASLPGEAPGATVPPLAVTFAAIVPPPSSVPPESVAAPGSSVPAIVVVPPLWA
jgi:hypothetical protein